MSCTYAYTYTNIPATPNPQLAGNPLTKVFVVFTPKNSISAYADYDIPTGMADTMLRDGLMDAFHGYHMGNTAENVATKYQISREEQDAFALASQQKASAAQKAGRFADEIAAVTVKTRKGDTVVADDEYIRHDASMESMAKLRPAFTKDGSVTAGNASGINDGAGAVVLMKASQAAKEGRKVLARIVSWAHAGVDPKIMGMGPVSASRKALERAGWKASDIDVFELNEAFASQALYCIRFFISNISFDAVLLLKIRRKLKLEDKKVCRAEQNILLSSSLHNQFFL